MPSSATDDLIRQLYESPPEGFVAARTAAVDEARKAGDRDTAKRLAALKKPTVAAWVVNLLALRRPELIEELVELSGALREAQRGLRGDQMRELTAQRRQVVSSLVAAARRLAQAEEPGIKLPLGEVEATLSAALAEPDVAAQVRTGRLIRAASYAGFGEVPRPRLRLVTDSEPDPDSDPDSDSVEENDEAEAEGEGEDEDAEVIELRGAAREAAREKAASAAAERRRREIEQRKRELRRELGAAEAGEQRADKQVERAEAAERDAEHLVEDLDAELAELERRRTEAQADVARRKLARRTAEREAAAARRRVGDVQAALEDLEADESD
jgi:DNA repair exonuclease SbcCD ATPase subunit